MTAMVHSLEQFGTKIIGSKDALELLIDLSPDALHIHLSLLVLFAIAFVVRRRPDHWIPWATLLLIEIVNEINDILHHSMLTPLDDRAAALHDLLNTMLWPTVLLIFGRMLFPLPVPKAVEPGPDSRDDVVDPAPIVVERK